ncbi:MBL fold metallo-hydrolase [Heyndrickxia acidicola]|uniref:MBL fold metallo-hydrolase n=1 Tax=Heyndrickxia acidicola TaxID=209389 RepID=A0ABU6MI23_9BACI|nr:MBL fold metallo-hydrolase [Heyndrickxia acidicola]MED1204084.1 MBL fold metallo-hydrolase [Heyndrickxia acidicola]
MQINMEITVLELEYEAFGIKHLFYPTVLYDGRSAVLVDAGMPGQAEQIIKKMESEGIPFSHLEAIIFTHQDLDHIGSAPELISLAQREVTLFAHPLEIPFISGELPFIKTNMAKIEKKELNFGSLDPPLLKVGKPLYEWEKIPYCGGIEVIFTPGHTPGHVSLYVKSANVLIAGDAMILANGLLQGPVNQTTLDVKTAIESLGKFLKLEIKTVICYHGGIYYGDPQKSIKALLLKK